MRTARSPIAFAYGCADRKLIRDRGAREAERRRECHPSRLLQLVKVMDRQLFQRNADKSWSLRPCLLLFAYELKRRLGASGCHTVHVSSLCPGFIPSTGLSREAGAFGQFFLKW